MFCRPPPPGVVRHFSNQARKGCFPSFRCVTILGNQSSRKHLLYDARRGGGTVTSPYDGWCVREKRFASGIAKVDALPTATYDQSITEGASFPSLVIGPNQAITPRGSFAEAQAQFLNPDPEAVERLSQSLLEAKMGIVAHYYMDVELQSVLTAVQRAHPALSERVAIADSLKMGDMAVTMCKNDDIRAVACLGVDFMAESVAAVLGKNGFEHVPVYRATQAPIGCSLAESAERDSYHAWLHQHAASPNTTGHDHDHDHDDNDNTRPPVLHIVYINTSLETKAVSSSIVPTITCTSSNVLQTMLQASAQVGPSLRILYGPDTYMGHNLASFFDAILDQKEMRDDARSHPAWDDARIARELHPLHNRRTIQQLRNNLHVFPHGNCVVHHMFGSEVVDSVLHHYEDAYVTAHLEVPGEMFDIAMTKSLEGRGVVGSTSNILDFISRKVQEEAAKYRSSDTSHQQHQRRRLKFILGTEAGMVTSIVRSVQDILSAHDGSPVEAEIIFPVSSEAVMAVDENDASHDTSVGGTTANGLAVVPGVGGGDGCSTAGGCATCPFMKMNSLDALQDILDMVLVAGEQRPQQEGSTATTTGGAGGGSSSRSTSARLKLQGYLPPNRLRGKRINNVDALELGIEPILHMRHFMKNKTLPEALVDRISQDKK